MNGSLSQTERLNIAAQALRVDAPAACLRSSYWVWFGVMFYGIVRVHVHLHWVIYVICGLAVISTVMIWRLHRYRFFATALTEFVGAAAFILTTVPSLQHIVSSSANYLIAVGLVIQASADVKEGKRYATAHSPGWKHEREQVDEWLNLLRGKSKHRVATEIKESTFLTGNRTYRFLDLQDRRVMAVFRTGREYWFPVDYQVRDSSAISIMERDGQALSATVDGRVITANNT